MYEPITAEQLPTMREAAPDLDDALRRLREDFKELGRCIYDVFAAAIRNMNPRNYHLYKYAKKARARNKNRNLLLKELHRWLN